MARDPKTGRRIPRGYGAAKVKKFLDSLPPKERASAIRHRVATMKTRWRHQGPGASMAYAREMLLFVKEYLRDFSVKRAGERCGFTYSVALRIYHEPQVRARIEREMTERYKRLDIDADKIVERLWEVINADPGDAYDDDGNLKLLHDMPPALRRTLAEYDRSKGRIKIQNKDEARALVAKHLGVVKDKVEIEGKITWAEMVLRSMPADERPQGWRDMGFKIEDEEDATLVQAPQLPEHVG